MSLLTIFNTPGIEVSTESNLKLSGQTSISDVRDLRQRGQDISFASRDLKIQAGISAIVPLGSIGSASDNTSSAGLSLSVPEFITAGSHIVLLITHASGGSVISVSDSRSNTWTIDKPSTFNGTLGVAIASAPITNSIFAGDNIIVTWNAAVTQKAMVGEIFRGIAFTNYVDRTASNADTRYLVDTGLTAQTINSKELVVGGLATLGAYDITFIPDLGTNFQERNSQTGNTNNRTVTGAFRIVTSQGTYTITGTLT